MPNSQLKFFKGDIYWECTKEMEPVVKLCIIREELDQQIIAVRSV